MSGGANELVAAYVNNGNSNLEKFGLLNGDEKTKNVYAESSINDTVIIMNKTKKYMEMHYTRQVVMVI